MINRSFLAEFVNKPTRAMACAKWDEVFKELKPLHDKAYPKEVIDKTRPGERKEEKKYRKDVYTGEIVSEFLKIKNHISKIRRAKNYRFEFPEQQGPIAEDETLVKYCEKIGLEKFIFGEFIRYYLGAPNSAVLVIPEQYLRGTEITESEFLNPVLRVVTENKIYYKNDLGIVCNIGNLIDSSTMGDKITFKDVYLFADRDEIIIVDAKSKTGQSWELDLGGRLPFIDSCSNIDEHIAGTPVRNSIIAPVVPHWHKAIQRLSDVDVIYNFHTHPRTWEFDDTEDCKKCAGTGRVSGAGFDNTMSDCPACNGSRKERRSPFDIIKVRQQIGGIDKNVVNPVTPPGGYIQRDIESAKELREDSQRKIDKGFGSIGLSFLQSVPMNISGKSKEMDKTEINDFFHSVAIDILSVMRAAVFLVNEFRYKSLTTQQREANLPSINEPQTFDVLTSDYYKQLTTDVKEKSTQIKCAAELEFCKKEFGQDSEAYKSLLVSINVNKVQGLSADEISQSILDGSLDRIDQAINNKVVWFVKCAFNQNPDFHNLDLKKQYDYIRALAIDELPNVIPADA